MTWTEDAELERRQADYERGFRDGRAAPPVVSVGVRERVAREICRIVRTWQGFVPTEEYTLEMEVENAWDDWLSEADAILAALRPTDTGREG